MNWTTFPSKGWTKLFEYITHSYQNLPQTLDIFFIIGCVLNILIKRRCIWHFDWNRPNSDINSQRFKRTHKFIIKSCNTAGYKRNFFCLSGTRMNNEYVILKIKI